VAAALKIRLLGGFRILYGEEPVRGVHSLRLQSLLAYLTLYQDIPHQRQHLAFLFWPDGSEKQARTNLRKLIHRLRRAFPQVEEFLELAGQTLRWRAAADIQTDVAVFERALASADQAEKQGNVEALEQWLQSAMDVYRGPLLPACYDNWIITHRERLQFAYYRSLERMLSLMEQQGKLRQAISCAELLLQHEPLRESVYRQLMRLHVLNGDRAEALRVYHTCAAVLQRELRVTPSPATRQQFQELFKFEEAVPSNIPSEPTAFVGRKRELDRIVRDLQRDDCSLLTLSGPGGVGKTRLAIQVALRIESQHRARFPDGVFFVSLDAVDSRSAMLSAIAESIHFDFYRPPWPERQLIDYLREKTCLLILDNFEHLIDQGGTEFLLEILQQAGNVKLLVTSRARLNVQPEWVFQVEGMRYPAEGVEPAGEQHDAVQLFAASARRSRSNFTVADQNLRWIRQICRLVEGHPLAIELAAAWVKVLSCQEIAAEIERNLDVLSTTYRHVSRRQQSIRAVLDQSTRMLHPETSRILSNLGVFPGSFTRQAARIIAGADLRSLSELVDKSLLKRNPAGRYALHALIRRYARQELDTHPRRKRRLQDLHSRYFLDFLQERSVVLKGNEQPAALDDISEEFENIRQAWQWALENGMLPEMDAALESLCIFFDVRGRFQEGILLFDEAAACYARFPENSGEKTVLAKIQARLGALRLGLGRLDEAAELLQNSLEVFRARRMPLEMANCLNYMGVLRASRGRFGEATHFCLESLSIYRQENDQYGVARVLNNLGGFARAQGDFAHAQEYYRQSLALHRQIENLRGVAGVLNNLGNVALDLGDPETAQRFYRESLEQKERLGDRRGTAFTLNNLGYLAYSAGDYEDASEFYRRSLAIFEELGDRGGISLIYNNLATLHSSRGAYGQARDLYRQSLHLKRKIRDRWGIAYTLNKLGDLALEQKNMEEARIHLREALETAVAIRAGSLVSAILVTVGVFLANTGNIERALTHLIAASGHPATDQETRDRAGQLLSSLRHSVPGENFALIQAGEYSLDSLIDEALNWLRSLPEKHEPRP